MRFVEILTELMVKKSKFEQILNNPSIQFGFECEMLITIPKVFIKDIESLTYAQIYEYFNIYGGTEDTINENYENWFNEQVEGEWEYHKSTLESDDEDEEPIDFDKEREEWDSNNETKFQKKYNIDNYISEAYGSNKSFIDDNNISEKHKTIQDNEYVITENDNTILFYIEEELSKLTGKTVEYMDSKQTKKSPDVWYMEPDGSLEDYDENQLPIEIVSSVYNLKEGIEMLHSIFSWMSRNNHETTNQTGLHINLSIKNKKMDDYDFFKMMLFFDENYIASLFNREDNDYTRQIRPRVKALWNEKETQNEMKILKDIRLIADGFKKASYWLDQLGKHSSFYPRDNGVVEFRSMGGSDYHLEFSNISKKIINMAQLMLVGADEHMYLKQYVKKIYDLFFNDKNYDIDISKTYPKQEISNLLPSFTQILNDHKDLQSFLSIIYYSIKTSSKSDVENKFRVFLKELLRYIERKKKKLYPAQTKELQAFADKYKINYKNIIDQMSDENPDKNILKQWFNYLV